jgi:hypothetical protein
MATPSALTDLMVCPLPSTAMLSGDSESARGMSFSSMQHVL